MASTISSSLLSPPLPRMRIAHPAYCKALTPKPAPAVHATRRDLLLFSLTAMPVLAARESASLAENIPLFGLRKNLKTAEQEAVKIVKEAEVKIETAEKAIQTAEEEIETTATASFGPLAQAGTVAGAEVVGVLVATAVVNGILGPES